MIKFKHLKVYNFLDAIRGMRNSWESWDKVDSHEQSTLHNAPNRVIKVRPKFVMGESDHRLAMNLSKAGSDHAKYLRQILVSVDIIAPEYWWKEFDTYKVGTVANSTSMMHKLGSRELEKGDFSFDNPTSVYVIAYMTIINSARQLWMDAGKKKPSPEWREMVQLVSGAFLYTRTVTLNYAVLQSIYNSRKNHRLQEWSDFRAWIETLPYQELITLKED